MLVQKEITNAYIGEYIPPFTPGANTFAYYTFDDQNNSQITDSSGNGRNLTGGTMPTYTLVSGTNYAGDYTNVSGSIAQSVSYSSLPSTHTLLVWVKPTNTSSSYISYLRSGNNSNQLSLIFGYNSGEFELFKSGGRTTIKSGVSINTRYLIGYTNNGSTIQTYCNGVASNSLTPTSGSYENFYLGCSNGGDRLKGQIGECVVEKTTRTNQEVLDYFNATKSNYGIS